MKINFPFRMTLLRYFLILIALFIESLSVVVLSYTALTMWSTNTMLNNVLCILGIATMVIPGLFLNYIVLKEARKAFAYENNL